MPDVADAAAVASPCTTLCEIDATSGLCRGCLRTLDEIAAWGGASNDGKRAIIAMTDARRMNMVQGHAG